MLIGRICSSIGGSLAREVPLAADASIVISKRQIQFDANVDSLRVWQRPLPSDHTSKDNVVGARWRDLLHALADLEGSLE